MHAYINSSICDGDYIELRYIVDQCIYSWKGLYGFNKLTCAEADVTTNYYNDPTGQCLDQYLINSTAFTEENWNGEELGCLLIDGCGITPDQTTTSPSQSTTTWPSPIQLTYEPFLHLTHLLLLMLN